jgi:serine/threonine protein phosphatase PrpC
MWSPPPLATSSAGLAVGAVRRDERGEDRLLVEPDLGLFGVFDGLGGHADGAAAAEIAATTVAARLREGLSHCSDQRQAHDLLIASLHAADAAIEQHNRNRGADDAAEPAGSAGTTATVVLLWSGPSTSPPAHPFDRVALLAHVGDTRAQLLRRGEFSTLTLDHAALNDSDPSTAKRRQSRLDQANNPADLVDPLDRVAFAYRNLLAQALTGSGDLDVRSYVVPLEPSDRLLLDSDGLHDNLTSGELAELAAGSAPPQQAAELLVHAAVERSLQEAGTIRAKPDDISVIVVDVLAAPRGN